MQLYTLAAIALLVAVVWVLARRATELFCLSVRRGKVLLIRGRMPPALLQELADVIERSRPEQATVRAVRQGGQPRLVIHGLDAGTSQRLRNVVGQRRWQDLRHAPSARPKNLGQRLGWTWLAWKLEE